MEGSKTDDFKLLRRFLTVYGVYNTKERTFLKKCHFYLVISICLLGSFGFGKGAIYSNLAMSERCITTVTAFCSWFAAMKISYIYWNIDHLNLLLDSLERYKPKTFLDKMVRKLVTMYSWMMNGMILLWVCIPIVFLQRTIPMNFSAPWDTESWPGFVIEYVLASLCLMCEAHIHTTMDSFVMLFSSQISHRLYLLQLSLENIGEKEKNEPDTIFDPDPLTHIQLCIEEHIFIKKLIKVYERLVSVVFLIQVLASTIIIGIVVFSVNTLEKTPNEVIKYIPIFGLVYSQIFMYCWSGENITTYCDQLTFSVYSCQWYHLPVNFRKCMLLFQLNSTQPVQIKGWHIIDMALTTFLASVQQSCSYFMILRQFVIEK